MEKKNTLTRILVIVGTVLVWFPILAPIILTLIFWVKERIFRFDYLMPAELFLVALLGGGVLLWAAFRARSWRKLIGWSLCIAVVGLVGSQALAVVIGLASGAAEPVGWRLALVVGLLAVYSLALIAAGVGGVLLLRDVFKPTQS